MQKPSSVPQSSTGSKTSPIPRQCLGAAVVERLREKILSGELREGEQLRQDAIATEFQISRIPVREALSHLAAEGLVTLVANRGAVVSALSPEEMMELFETRAVLECYMLRCAIPRMKPEDFQRAEDVLRTRNPWKRIPRWSPGDDGTGPSIPLCTSLRIGQRCWLS